MQYKPHNYQRQAIDFILTHPQAAIFLGLGMGKTLISLTAIWSLLLDSFQVRRVLVIAPLQVARDTWPAELAKWEHLKDLTMAVAIGSEKQRLAALNQQAMVTVINRENVPWLVNHYGAGSWPFDMVVIDELSSFKNHRAKRFKALMYVRHHITRIVGLTGTPASNGLMDLWAEFRLLDGGRRLGRYITKYRTRWFDPDRAYGRQVYTYKLKPGAEEEIYQAISDITLSMKTVDYLKLPELTKVDVPVAMSTAEYAIYKNLKREMVLKLGEDQIIDAANAGVLSGKLLQMASGAVYADGGQVIHIHDRKLDALEDLIEAANDNPVLIAYWWQHDLQRICARFPQARTITSSTDIIEWNQGAIPIGLIHPASAGHGINLQAGGSILIWFSLPWSLELYLQANGRIYRQGQQKPVTIARIISAGTIDGEVAAALAQKNITQTALIEAIKTQLANHSR